MIVEQTVLPKTHQVRVRQIRRRAQIDVVQHRKRPGRPLEQRDRDAVGAVGGARTRGLDQRVLGQPDDVLHVGLAARVAESHEPAELVVRQVVLDPRRGVAVVVPGQDGHVRRDARRQGTLRGPRPGQAPGDAGGRERSGRAAVARGAGRVESQNSRRAVVSPGRRGPGGAAPVVEGDVRIPDDLAAGLQVLAKRAAGGGGLDDRVRRGVLDEHDDAELLVGDSGRHPGLQLVGVEDFVAGGRQGVARGLSAPGPGSRVAAVPVGRADPVEIRGSGLRCGPCHQQENRRKCLPAHAASPKNNRSHLDGTSPDAPVVQSCETHAGL